MKKIFKTIIKTVAPLFSSALLFLSTPTLLAQSAPLNDPPKIVTVYLLIDRPDQLAQYVSDLNRVSKVNFNRVIFSFIKPTLTNYKSNNLENTGILGYFGKGDSKGAEAFQKLKAAIELSKTKKIQTFISVGGWNYSCNNVASEGACGSAEQDYDYFPDPTDSKEKTIAETSYGNLIKLANDLGVDGIDFDYEEFWHANMNAVLWQPGREGEWNNASISNITYESLMQYGAKGKDLQGPWVMPKTVEKVEAILKLLVNNPNSQHLLFASAVPPVGARPIIGFVYGDNYPDINVRGAVWWMGNLKGLWYNLAFKNEALVRRFDSLGLMTYDLCGDNERTCAPYGGAKLDLASQVGAYLRDYQIWLKSTNPVPAFFNAANNGAKYFYPATFNLPAKIQFGFEVGKPAYPTNEGGQLQLTNALVDTITKNQKSSDGVIIWEMYSSVNSKVPDATTTQYTINQSCKAFLAHDPNYDCNANFPGVLPTKK